MDEAQATRTVTPSTGDASVDRVLTLLDGLECLPVTEHAAVYLDIHERLVGELDPDRKPRPAGAHGSP